MDHECGVTATIKRGYTADAAVVSEPSAPPDPLRDRPRQPRPLWFSVTVPGKASHASMRAHTFRAGGLGASVAVNAIDKGVDMFNAIRRLEDEWGQTKRHPLPRRPLHDPPGRRGRWARRASLVPFFISEFMTIEYCCWYHPDEGPKT